jgi:hypothetical protein
VVWLTLGADPRVISVCSAAQRLIQENRPCHVVWDPLTGDIAQLLPIVRAGCALGTPENIYYAPDLLPHRQPSVNREGRLCVQIGVLSSPREPFTSYQMLGLGEILAWLDSWHIPRRWPAGAPAPFRTAVRARSRALWALGGHFGASQVPDCESIGPGGIDIDQIASMDTVVRELPEPALAGASLNGGSLNGASLNGGSLNGGSLNGGSLNGGGPIRLGPRSAHEVQAAPPLSAAAV